MEAQRLHILIVEDNEAHAAAICRAFELAGTAAEIQVVSTLWDFRHSVMENPPDVALVDLVLPDGRTLEILTQLTEAGSFPILVMTSFSNEQTAVEAIKKGALDYIVKSPAAFRAMPDTVRRVRREWRLLIERKQMELRVFESEARLRSIFNKTSVGMALVDLAGRVVMANEANCHFLGYSQDELVGMHFSRFIHPDDYEQDQTLFDALGRGEGKSYFIDKRHIRKNGDEVWGRLSVSLVRDAAGQPQEWIVSCEDITQQKIAAEVLRQSEEKYRLLVNQIPAMIYKGYADGRVEFFDQKIEFLTGYTPEEFNSRRVKWTDLILPEDLPETRAKIREALKGDGAYTREYRIRTKKGEILWLQAMGQIFRDPGGRIDYISGVILDITARKQAEETLQQREILLREILDTLPVGVWLADKDGKITKGNPAAQKIWQGVKYVALEAYDAYKSWWRATGEPIGVEESALARAIRGGAVSLNELVDIECFDGSRKTIVNSAVPLKGSRGEIQGAIVINQDVTSDIRVHDRLAYQAQLLSNVSDTVIAADLNFRITYWNPAAEKMYGWQADEVVGKPIAEIIPVRFLNHSTREIVRQEMLEKGKWRGEAIQFHRDGRPFITDWSINAIKDLMGNLIGTVSISRDVTARHRMEKELKDREAFLQNTFASIQDGICVLDRDLSILQVNPTMERWYSQSLPLVGKKCFAAFQGRSEPCEVCPTRQALESGQASTEVVPWRDDHWGVKGWLEIFSFPLIDQESGKNMGAIEHFRSITEQLQAEAALRESEAKFRGLLETMHDGFGMINEEGKLIFLNEKVCEILGLPKKTLMGSRILEVMSPLLSPEDREGLKDQLARRRHGESGLYELEITRLDGKTKFLLISASPIFDTPGVYKGSQAVITDITERRKEEETRLLLASAIEQANESIIITDDNKIIQYVNPAFERTTGFTKDGIIGWNIEELRHGNGRISQEMWTILKQGRTWSGRISSLKKDGTRYEEEVAVSPIVDRRGKVINYVSVGRDITHEVQMERRLRQAQKMEAIGTLAAGIAHDFNNILGSIILNTELALQDQADENPSEKFLQRVLRAGERARGLVEQILTFSRQTSLSRQPMDIGPILKETLKFVRATLPSTIDMRLDLKGCGPVLMDATQFQQIVMNLCANVPHAMWDQRGLLEVTLEEIDLGEHAASLHPDLKPGSYAKLTVRDNGIGIDPVSLERIFDPFFTTKPPGEGTGLGLAVVHGIISSYEGVVLVESQPGAGTTFQIFLPVMERGIALRQDQYLPIPRGTEHVLFVDDEEDLVEAGQQILERLGYRVTGVSNSLGALEELRRRPGDFDLVITDLTMPLLSGLELIKEILLIRPGMPIIICTGFNELPPKSFDALGAMDLLRKPLTTRVLSETIRRVLDARP